MTNMLAWFREEFPEFDDVADSAVNVWLGHAAEIHSLSETATLYLAAHLVALDGEDSVGQVDGGAGVITSETIGPKSATYMTQARSGDETFFARTQYGRLFLTIERRVTAFSARVF